MKAVTIEFPSILDNLRIVESFIDQNREDYSITDDLYGNIPIALTEAVNNAIQHGNRNDKAKMFRLTCNPGPSELSFVVEDPGSGFDSPEPPFSTSDENLQNPDGTGVFLHQHPAEVTSF